MISQEKWKILSHLQNLPKNVGDLGKLIVAKGFKKLPKVQKIAKSGHTDHHIPILGISFNFNIMIEYLKMPTHLPSNVFKREYSYHIFYLIHLIHHCYLKIKNWLGLPHTLRGSTWTTSYLSMHLSMELISRRRWANSLAQQSNINGNAWFILGWSKHNSLPLGPILCFCLASES